MKIAILGAGSVGSTLGRRFAEAGHTIAFGVRKPGDAKYQQLGASIGGASVSSVHLSLLSAFLAS